MACCHGAAVRAVGLDANKAVAVEPAPDCRPAPSGGTRSNRFPCGIEEPDAAGDRNGSFGHRTRICSVRGAPLGAGGNARTPARGAPRGDANPTADQFASDDTPVPRNTSSAANLGVAWPRDWAGRPPPEPPTPSVPSPQGQLRPTSDRESKPEEEPAGIAARQDERAGPTSMPADESDEATAAARGKPNGGVCDPQVPFVFTHPEVPEPLRLIDCEQNADVPRRLVAPPLTNRLVELVRRHLRDLGCDPGPAVGLIGPRPRGAIGRFQRNHGDAPTGIISFDLLEQIRSATATDVTGD
jgi:hypothetical protein